MERKEAIDQGLKRYNNGKPCPKGHQPPIRYTMTAQCCECVKLNSRKFIDKTTKQIMAARSQYIVLSMTVHKDSYNIIYSYIESMNKMMGVPSSANPPLVPQAAPAPREWASNPFESVPLNLPVEEIAVRLKAEHAAGRHLSVSLDNLKRFIPSIPKTMTT